MIASSNKALLLALLLAAAPAQAAPPHDTAPMLDDERGDSGKDAATPEMQDGGVAIEPQDTISESPVSGSPVEGFGTLEQGKGALAQDIWKGSTRESADPLLKEMHTGIASDPIRDIVTRLLMTQATPPQGGGSPNWFVLRVNALVAMGQDDKADEMISSLPASMKDNSLIALQTGLQLIRGQYDEACQKAQPDALPQDDSGEGFWRKLSILCQAHAGKQEEATVGIDLMREERHTDDLFFQEAIRRIADKNATIRSNPAQWTLLNVALVRLSGDSEKLKNGMDFFPPVAVKYLAQDASLDIKLRIKAQGRAVQLGVLPEPAGNIAPEQPFSRQLASDVTTLVKALGSEDPAAESDNAVIARLALDDAGIADSRRVERLLTLMEPFGYRVPGEIWVKLFRHNERIDGDVPPAVLVARINDAAVNGRRGEVLLLAGLITGEDAPDRIPDLVLLPVIKALITAGFETQARALAHEAVQRYSSR